ncbi:MAG TPA: hypothetical protein VHE35_20585, partial [Kofleriaceae bacterium]|nr:hypothetical protein [Kofleriaceae bacterium]
MRAEDQLEAEEEEEAQEILLGLEEGRDDERAEELVTEELPEASRYFRTVVAAMRTVLEGRDVDIEQLTELSRQEKKAFEALKHVVQSRGRRGGFIYAEQRIERLNQVLAVLQPALSMGSAPGMEEARGELETVIDEVDDLREKLNSLEATEEELDPQGLEAREADGDKDDDDDEDDDLDDTSGEVPEPGAPARPSTLSAGAAVPDRAPAPTTLTGTPAAPDWTTPPSTVSSGGPEAPAWTTPRSTLSEDDGAAPAAPAAPR